jgi:hypothetical protein
LRRSVQLDIFGQQGKPKANGFVAAKKSVKALSKPATGTNQKQTGSVYTKLLNKTINRLF